MCDAETEKQQNEALGQANIADGSYNFSFVAYDYA